MRTLFLSLLMLVSSSAFALSGTTKDGYIACRTEEHLNDIMSFVAAKDTASVEAYRSSNKCIILKGGLKVTVLDTTWTGKLQFAFQGLKMWTVMEAVDIDFD